VTILGYLKGRRKIHKLKVSRVVAEFYPFKGLSKLNIPRNFEIKFLF
jgi:hypothetical protein